MPDPERLGVERWVTHTEAETTLAVPFGSRMAQPHETVVELALSLTHLCGAGQRGATAP